VSSGHRRPIASRADGPTTPRRTRSPGLSTGHRGRLQGRRHHDHSIPSLREERADRGEGLRPSRSGRTLDDQERGAAGQFGNGGPLRDVQGAGLAVAVRGCEGGEVGGLFGAVDKPADDVGLDGEYVGGGQGADVFGYVGAGEKRVAAAQHPGGEASEIDPDRGVDHQAGGGDPLLDLTSDVGGVPRRPPCAQPDRTSSTTCSGSMAPTRGGAGQDR
jgi:hypothetical protein